MRATALYDLPAPAKLNLFLHVVGRRADGYHLLESVFQLIDWCDTLHIELRRDGKISRTDLGPALPDEDLCVKAARALQVASGTAWGAHISIDKQVPWGAGLGGGSSDAATTLIALNRLWQLDWPRPRLLALAETLGADVPFFVQGQNAWVTGIGEQIQPLTLPPAQFLVVKPDVAISTPAIFSSALLSRSTPPAILSVFLADQETFGKNDLETCAEALSSKVKQALELVKQCTGSSRLTGSGSAVFSRVKESAEFDQVCTGSGAFMVKWPKAWEMRICKSLDIHPLFDF